ncbi:MAG: hypothetical protein IT372_33670 [Polyangiaceae bacterium]|nr:hypothetical protein [Polyangiaceae bacterium]
MATDAFSRQIVELVRKMPDDAILALVKNQLGAVTGEVALAAPAPRRGRARPAAKAPPAPVAAAPKAAPAAAKRGAAPKRKPGRPRKTQAASAERQETLETVERIVKASTGLSASEVAKSAGIPQTRAAAALKELKLAKRIFQGGDRRFARYAGDAKTAEQASITARRTAAGPSKPKAAPKPRKRSAPQPTAAK